MLNMKDVKLYCLQFLYTGIVVCLAWSLICFIGYSLTAAFIISTQSKTSSELFVLLYPSVCHFIISTAAYAVCSQIVSKALIDYCLISNTEMMKDRKAIEDVVRT